MSKVALFIILCLSISAFALDVSRFDTVDPNEEDIEELFALYLMHSAPMRLEPSIARYNHFKSKVISIINHNRDPTKTWRRTINKFTGLTMKELQGLAIMEPQHCSATNGVSSNGLGKFPDYFDWRLVGIVSPVKDQGNCGSCWTFSTTGAVEAHWSLIKQVNPPDLSEQQLVDCAGDFNNFGCNGGLPSQAFEYIRYAGGIDPESKYPYTGKDGECNFLLTQVAATVPAGSVNITSGDEDSLQDFLFNAGPISIAFEVTDDFMDYEGGVYSGKTCHTDVDHVNHAVLAVGYGHDSHVNMDYWIVKNSWSTTWGEEGYFRIQRGKNMCGLAVCASYPQIKTQIH